MKQTIPATEQVNTCSRDLDKKTPNQLAAIFNAQDYGAARAVKNAHREIATVMLRAARTYATGHKIIFIGAGTSGRLGILEAVECVPTFRTKPSQIIGLIAGGHKAVFRSQEGAEDDAKAGAQEIAYHASQEDLVIGLAASGNTPYVQGALKKARQIGAHTALISCNEKANVRYVQTHIYLPTGPEALTGSTRMKAGTATKMALNAITTGAMVLCGKTYGNLMIDVQPTNQKLIARAVRLICAVAQTDTKTARQLLSASGKNVKVAILMHRKHLSRRQAQKNLQQARGFLKEALTHD